MFMSNSASAVLKFGIYTVFKAWGLEFRPLREAEFGVSVVHHDIMRRFVPPAMRQLEFCFKEGPSIITVTPNP